MEANMSRTEFYRNIGEEDPQQPSRLDAIVIEDRQQPASYLGFHQCVETWQNDVVPAPPSSSIIPPSSIQH